VADTSIETAQTFGMRLLKALGVDTSNVTGFVITCHAGDIPRMELHRVISCEQGKAAAALVEEFTLVPKQVAHLGSVDVSVSLESLTETTHRLPDSRELNRT
jgi:hypothetical protein